MAVDKMIKLCCLILMSTVAYVYAAVAIYPYEPKPDKFADQEGCYISEFDRVFPYKKPVSLKDGKSCMQITCGTNNESQLFTCGAIAFPDNCHLVRDYNLDYPDCCGKVVCDPTTEVPTTESSTATTPITDAPGIEEPSQPVPPRKPEQPKSPNKPVSPTSPKSPTPPQSPTPPKTS